MAISTLPASPAGEISHNTVREKVNEVIDETNITTQAIGSVYVWSDDITATDPGTAGIKGNNGTESLITELYMSSSNFNGQDIDSINKQLDKADFAILKRYDAQENFFVASVTGKATDNGGWFTIPVSIEDVGGGFVADDSIEFVYFPTAGRDPNLLSIDRMVNTEYLNAAPVSGVEYNTLYDPSTATESTTEVSGIALISAGGNQFAVFSRVSATALVGSPDVRVSRSSTFPGITGSAEMVFWYDSVTETIHIQADLNGGGKVIDALQVVSAFDKIISV